MSDEEDKAYLSEKMLSLGYGCCKSPEAVRETLSQLGRIVVEDDIARVLGMMIRYHTDQVADDGGAQTWDVNVFFSTLNELVSCVDYYIAFNRNYLLLT